MANVQIINGKDIAARLRTKIADDIKEKNITPGLAVILVGDDPASRVYINNKIKACEKVGIESYEHIMPADSTQQQVRHAIINLNKNPDIHGILLQLPLPDHLDSLALVNEINPIKDVDGLHSLNAGRLIAGLPGMIPCTPQGSLMLIKEVQKDLTGCHAVIIGRSLLFGKPMAQLLLAENCTVTQCHSKSRDLPDLCRQADILIAAAGQLQMVKGDWIKPGAIVIDVGINRMDDGTLTGDVDFAEAVKTASAVTPVPGGVGPMTIACLLANTVKATISE